MTRSKRFLRGLSVGYVNMGATLAVGLLLTPFLIRHLGQTELGIWLVLTQILMFLGLVDFGIVAILSRETAYALARSGDTRVDSELPTLISRTKSIVLMQVPVLVAACSLLLLFLPSGLQDHRMFILAVCVAFVVRFPMRIYQEVLTGMQDLTFVGATQLTALVVSTTATVILVLRGAGLFALVVNWSILQLGPTVAAYVRLKIMHPHLLREQLQWPRWHELRFLITKAGWVSAGQLAQVLSTGSDLIMIERVMGAAAVVPYSVTSRLVGISANAPYMIMQQASPALSELRILGTPERLLRLSLALTGSVLLLGGLCATVIQAINQGFVEWWIGAEFYGGGVLTTVLILTMIVRQFHVAVGYAVFCFGHEKRLCLTALLETSTGAVAAIVFIFMLGAVGAPLGALFGMAVVGLPLNLYVLSRETGGSLVRYLGNLLPWLSRFACALSLAASLAWYRTPRSLVEILLYCSMASAFYVALEMHVALRPPLGDYVRPLLDRLARRFSVSRREA